MGKDKVDSGKCGFGVCGVAKFNIRCIFLQVDFTCLCYDLLTLCVVVVEHNLVDGETVPLGKQHKGNSGCEGASASGNSYGK